jgi:hypothetical protein
MFLPSALPVVILILMCVGFYLLLNPEKFDFKFQLIIKKFQIAGLIISALSAIICIIMISIADVVYVIVSSGQYEKYYGWGDSINFSYKNNETHAVPLNDQIVINNTPNRLIYEIVYYGDAYRDSRHFEKVRRSILGYSSNTINYRIDYILKDPPTKMMSKTEFDFVGWLHF